MAITGSLKLSVFMLLYTCDVLMEKINYKKKYGQNFLYDENILENIIKNTSINEDDLIIEIGPGSGNLTKNFKHLMHK